MKFSCPKCAAKYQIADEKVAGRTVKMKCRKCGTTIPIGAKSSPADLARAAVVRADSLRPAAPAKPGARPAGAAGPARTAVKAPARAGAKAPAPRAQGLGGLRKSPGAAAQAAAGIAPTPDIVNIPAPVDWHAGIDGKSVGPMSEREIERRIGEGSITAETYVWTEGMDGWKQLPEVPELELILTRSIRPLAVAPPSMPAPAKAQAPAVALRPAPLTPAPVTPAPVRPAPLTPVVSDPVITEAAVPAAWANVMDGLGDEKGPEAPAPSAPLNNLQEAPIPHIDMPRAGEPGPHSMRPSYDSLVMQLHKKRKNPLAVPFAVLAAVIFGVTIGFVLFGDQETKIVKQIVEVPAKVSEAMEEKGKVAALADAPPSPRPEAPSPQSEAPSPGATVPSAGTKTTGAATPTSGKPAEVKGLKGLAGLDGLGGPSAGPTGPSTTTAGGTPLSSGQIESTVSQYRTGVKRGCWERAMMTRDKNAPSSARVTVSITVSPSGSVTGASSGGDPKGYSGLASCITQRVRGWSFPRSSGQTTVNVPFVFAAQ